MLVRQRIVNRSDGRHGGQDLITHLVHGVLDACATVGGKGLGRDSSGIVPGLVELGYHGFDMVESIEGLPCPSAVDFSTQDTVVHFWERGVLVTDKVVKGRAGALEDEESCDSRTDGDAFAFSSDGFDITCLCAVAEEGVRVRLPVDGHASPAMYDDLDMGGVDVFVCGDEVGGDDGSEEFGWSDGMLLRHDINGVFHGVSCDDDTVIGLGVSVQRQCQVKVPQLPPRRDLRSVDFSLQQDANSHLDDGLDTSRLVTVDLVHTNVVLAIACRGKLRHVDGKRNVRV